MSATTVAALVRTALRERWPLVVAAALALACGIAVELLLPWPLKIVVDHVLLQRPLPEAYAVLAPVVALPSMAALAVLAGAIAVLALLAGTFAYLQSFLAARIGFEVVHAVRVELFSRLVRHSLAFHARTSSGELLTRIGTDAVTIRDVFADWIVKAVGDALLIAGSLVVLFAMDWRLASVVAATLPVLYFVLRRVGHAIRVTAREQRRQDGELATRLNATLGSIALIQAFGREPHESERFGAESARSREAGVRNARAAALVSRSVGLVAALATAATVFVGGAFVLRGAGSPGDLLIFVAYVTALFKPVRDLGKLWAKFARARASAERLGELLAQAPDVADVPGAVDVGPLRGELALDRVNFAYVPDRPVLQAATVTIRAGEHVAVIGRSGGGKSTLLRLALRLCEPETGVVRVDGRDVRELTLASLRREIGVVLQDAVFVGASIAENVRYGDLDATSERVERAARLAGLHEFVATLPQGYDTLVGERGALLSGGQRQRLSLARTLVRDPAILILDEPTSAVDPASARAIEHAIAQHRAGRTTIVIGHQFGTFAAFDRVLEVREGRIHDVTARMRVRGPGPLAAEVAS